MGVYRMVHAAECLVTGCSTWLVTRCSALAFYRVCSMVHGASEHPFWYSNVARWWKGPEVCTRPNEHNDRWSSWRHRDRKLNNLLAVQRSVKRNPRDVTDRATYR